MLDKNIKILYFPKPLSTNDCNGCCGDKIGDNQKKTNCGCQGNGCMPQRDIKTVYKEFSERNPKGYEYSIVSYENDDEIDKAISSFNTIMERSQEKIHAKDSSEMFKYLAKYAPLTAINDHLVYVQNTPAASHIEHAINSFFK